MKFEKVNRFAAADFNLPVRKTKGAAGYDFEVAEDILIEPYEDLMPELHRQVYPEPWYEKQTFELSTLSQITKNSKIKPTLVSTGVKCQLDPGYYLELSVRSSTPLKYWLIMANGVGIIDADYYENESNDGEIFFQLINLSPFPIQLRKGDIIGQGIIKKYYTVDEEEPTAERIGGLGSTTQTLQNSLHLGNCAISPQEIQDALKYYDKMNKEYIFNLSQAAEQSTLSLSEAASGFSEFAKTADQLTGGQF